MIRWFTATTALLLAAPAWAQISVRLDLERDRYVLYEPMIATVEVSNYNASELQLADQESTPWLRFDIYRSNGEYISAVGPGFLAGSVAVPPNQTRARSANLVAYYKIRDPGKYRVRALVKIAGGSGSFASREQVIEVVVGRTILTKPAGFKDESGKDNLRNHMVLEARLGSQVWLYARTEDHSGDTIYGVVPLGEWVTFSAPTAATDRNGNLHVLHQAHPRLFRYSIISPNSAVLGRDSFSNHNSVPELRRGEDGAVKVVGGERMSRPLAPVPSLPKSP
jgi:hypothetical protein